MEDSQHMAFNGQASNDMVMALDLEHMMANDMTLSEGLDAFTTGIHDDTCLDHNAFSHCNVGAKAHAYPPRPSPMAQRSLSQNHVRQRHSISTSAAAGNSAPVPQQDQQTFPSPWDSIFTDTLLNNGMACTGFDACQDNDCASVSCNSDCAGSCPSQCGEPVGVCCDDDACGPPDLCVDEDCHGATAPCKEPACSLSDNEAAAAVTLTTFGDKSAAGQSDGLNNMQTVPPTPNQADISYLDLPAVPCSSLSLDNSYGNANMFSGEMWDVAPEFILANHILQYHDPSHHEGHVRPCIADKPSSVMTMCSLPKHDTVNGDALNAHSSDGVCGFQIQDPYAFAQHIFQQHRPSMAQSNLTHPHYHPMLSTHHFSSTTSPSTNISLGNSLSPTPASLPTPSTVEAPNFFDLGANGKDTAAASKEDQYICRWLVPDGRGGHTICGHTGKDHKDLQDHCKGEHLKKIKKDHTGFYCQWQGCTRHATFSQRSKLERHMQVHTGCKYRQFSPTQHHITNTLSISQACSVQNLRCPAIGQAITRAAHADTHWREALGVLF